MIVKRFNGIKGGSTFFSFLKWANSGLFLFIFVLFKHNFTEKTVGFSGIRTRIASVEGEHVDHLTPPRPNALEIFVSYTWFVNDYKPSDASLKRQGEQ